MKTTYAVIDPAGQEHVLKGAGPWFYAWRLTRDCARVWGLKKNHWMVSGGWARRSRAVLRARAMRHAEGFSENAPRAALAKKPGRLMCGPRNVRILRGKPLLQGKLINEEPYQPAQSPELLLTSVGGFHA